MKKTIAGALIALALLSTVHADVLLTYDFSTDTNPNFAAAGFSGGTLGRDTGESISLVGTGNPAPGASSVIWLTTTDYYIFSITNNSGADYHLGNLSWDQQSSEGPIGPSTFALRSDADSYTTNLLTGSITLGLFTNESVNLNQDLPSGSTINYRLYATGSTAKGGAYIIDNITFNGNAPAAPEPATFALMLGAGLFFCIILRARRSFNF